MHLSGRLRRGTGALVHSAARLPGDFGPSHLSPARKTVPAAPELPIFKGSALAGPFSCASPASRLLVYAVNDPSTADDLFSWLVFFIAPCVSGGFKETRHGPAKACRPISNASIEHCQSNSPYVLAIPQYGRQPRSKAEPCRRAMPQAVIRTRSGNSHRDV